MESKRDERIIEMVRRLLALANDPATSPAEREQALDEANRRMNRHAIDQAMLDATRTIGEKRKPTKKLIVLFDNDSTWGSYFTSTIMQMCITNRCRYAFHSGYRQVTVVGMQDDVDWVEMLWLNVFLHFSSKIKPSWDIDQPVAVNIYNFKNAGYKWKDIWDIGDFKIPGGMPDGNDRFIPNKCKYMITGYKKMCEERGTAPIGTQTFEAYKLTFTQYYTAEVNTRLETMRAANEEEAASSGGVVALRDMSEDILSEFYRLFPMLSPESIDARNEIWRKEEEDAEKRDAAYLASLTPAARKAVLDKRAQEEARQARLRDRWYRDQAKKRTYDAAGATAGEAAGREVDLTRSGPATTSGSRTELN